MTRAINYAGDYAAAAAAAAADLSAPWDDADREVLRAVAAGKLGGASWGTGRVFSLRHNGARIIMHYAREGTNIAATRS